MATVIKLKRGTTTPTTGDIISGEVAIDTSAQKLYVNDSDTIKTIGLGNPSLSDLSDSSDIATLTGSQILTNKTINASNNTLSNIPNSSLTNSSFTVTDGTTSDAVSLGDILTFSGTSNEVDVAVSTQTTVLDDSDFPATFAGSSAISTSESKFGGASLRTTSTSNFAYVSNSNFLAGRTSLSWIDSHTPFTVECWFRCDADSDGGTLFGDQGAPGTYAYRWQLAVNPSTSTIFVSAFFNSTSNNSGYQRTNTISQSISTETWHHIAVVDNGTNWLTFFNGTLINTGTRASASDNPNRDRLDIGYGFEGYIDECRISSVARYTTDGFTPSTTQFTWDEDTDLLIHWDGDNNDTTQEVYTGASENTIYSTITSSLANNSITIAGDSGSDGVSLGETLTISGTANEIETTGTSNTLTIGLPNDVTIGNDLTVGGDLTIDTDTLYVDSSNDKVGINTTTIYNTTSIRGDSLGIYKTSGTSSGSPLGGQLYLGDSAYYNQTYYVAAPGIGAVYDSQYGNSASLALYTYQNSVPRTERMRITGDGDVGIGTSSPSYKLEVTGDAYVSTNLTVGGNLTVSGTTTTLDTTNTTITDNLLELNSGATANTNDSGIIIERGSTGDNAIMAWDESADEFIFGTTTATASDTGDLTITAANINVGDITVAGDIIPDANGTRNLGSATKRFAELYLTGSTINLGGSTISSDGTGTIQISANGATLPLGSKIEVAESTTKTIALEDEAGTVIRSVPFFSAAGGLSTPNARLNFRARTAGNTVANFTLANGTTLAEVGEELFLF